MPDDMGDSQAESVSHSHSDFIDTMQRLRAGPERTAQHMEVEADTSSANGDRTAAHAPMDETASVSDSIIFHLISAH